MKQTLLIAVAALMFTPAVFAQAYKLDEKKLLQQIETSDKAIANEKQAARAQTWITRGDVMYEAATAVSQRLYGGMPAATIEAERGKDFTTSTKEVGGRTYSVVSYPSVDIYIQGDAVRFWDEKITVYESAAEKAYEAYKKAAELDPKQAQKMAEKINVVANIYKQRSANDYALGRNEEAARNFEKAYEVQLDPLVGVSDSLMMYNAGYVYLSTDNFEKAIENFQKARAVDFWQDGDLGYYMMYAYLRMDQNDKAKEIITEAATLFPENKKVIEGMISIYAMTGEDMNEIRDVIIAALEKDPENLALLHGLGQIYYNEENADKTIEIYSKFLEVDPDNVAGNFFLGSAWLMKGTEKLDSVNKSNQGMSEAARKEGTAQANEMFRKAMELLEKAYELNPTEKAIVNNLTIACYRLIEEGSEMEAKFEKYNKLKEQMSE